MIRSPRGLAMLGFAIFGLFGLYYAVFPAAWHGTLVTPPTVAAQTVAYSCGPLWGSGYAHGPAHLAYPLSTSACSSRGADRAMDAFDIVVAVIGVVLTLAWRRVGPVVGASTAAS
jgi:hypothetical protein